MSSQEEPTRDEFMDAVVALRVHEELDERLVEVYSDHRDPVARERLRNLLNSPRLQTGIEITERIAPRTGTGPGGGFDGPVTMGAFVPGER
jgi:hypothetical protein